MSESNGKNVREVATCRLNFIDLQAFKENMKNTPYYIYVKNMSNSEIVPTTQMSVILLEDC